MPNEQGRRQPHSLGEKSAAPRVQHMCPLCRSGGGLGGVGVWVATYTLPLVFLAIPPVVDFALRRLCVAILCSSKAPQPLMQVTRHTWWAPVWRYCAAELAETSTIPPAQIQQTDLT